MHHALLALPLAAALTAGACGGNYSNLDVEFQLALPEKSDLQATMPVQSLTVEGAAEYLRTTRDTVTFFNAVADILLGMIDHVRHYPPTTREPERRIWGPFPDDKRRPWVTQILIERVPDPRTGLAARFDYRIQLRPAAGGAWIDFLWGSYAPTGGVRRGSGELHLDTRAARAAGFPVDDPADRDDLNDLERLDLEYHTLAYPIVVKMAIANLPTSENPGATYQYGEEMDGSGSMTFLWRLRNPAVQALEIRSRWKGSGAGRADARVAEGGAAILGLKGVDCWDIQGRATYVQRDWERPPLRPGSDLTTCVFP